ncbi:MAG: RNA 3'-phosphate cyclase [Armatimonadetes bacterium]|nr:RNA 3'-phosphate cyclase [Armatimonadota bacterium]
MTDLVTIDGSAGGGQILRNAIALSAVCQRPVRVTRIRTTRPKPGLRPQHLAGVLAAAEMCGADVTGAEIGSQEIAFHPTGPCHRDTWSFDIGTAGSMTLLLQCLLPSLGLSRSPTNITLTGGTDVPFSPPVDYFDLILTPALSELRLKVTTQVQCRGFYPRGGGQIRVRVEPTGHIQPFCWTERGSISSIRGRSYSQRLPNHIAERMRNAALDTLREAGQPEPEVELDIVSQGPSPGCGLVLWAECETGRRLAGSSLGRQGVRAEKVGAEAAGRLLHEIEAGAAVETHLADQLIVWMALACGPSEMIVTEVSDHVRSAVHVAEAVSGALFSLEEGVRARIRCEPHVSREQG